jgi:hypothetical protein
MHVQMHVQALSCKERPSLITGRPRWGGSGRTRREGVRSKEELAYLPTAMASRIGRLLQKRQEPDLRGSKLQTYNGMPASGLQGVAWHKSCHSNPNGSCLEVAELPDGSVAVRNSRYPGGPALIYTPAEITAFLLGAKDGEFDYLIR